MSLTTHLSNEHVILATWHNAVVTVALGQMPLADLDLIDRVQRALLARFPGGLTSVSIIPEGSRTGLPSAEFRAAASKMTAQWEPHLLGTARVVEVQGFSGSTIRGVLTGIDLIAQSRVPTTVVRSRSDAARWICGLAGQPPEVRSGADELGRALMRL